MMRQYHISLAALLWLLCASTFALFAAPDGYHKIQAGETLYSISKLYRVPARDIVQANPGLTLETFRPGETLLIPIVTNALGYEAEVTQPAPVVEEQPSGLAGSGYQEMYRIEKGDNLYKIALEYGITVEELKQANPELGKKPKLRKGDFLFIPAHKETKVTPTEYVPTNEELLAVAEPQPIQNIRIAVLLPIKEQNVRGRKMLEFYQGLLMAADSVKHQGANIDVYALHSGSTDREMVDLLRTNPSLKRMHAIFGPMDQEQIPALSEFCLQNKIRLILPFANTSVAVYTNPYIYMACAPQDTTQTRVLDLVEEHYLNSNFVVLDAGSEASDKRASAFIEALRDRLSTRGIATRDLSIEADEFALKGSLNPFRHNIIVPNSATLKTLNLTTAKLKDFCTNNPEYHVQLLGYPEWQTYTATALSDLYHFDALAYSTFYRNPLETRTNLFEHQYTSWFRHTMYASFPRYGMTGFDLGYYILHGLHTMGTAFDQEQGQMDINPYQSHFHFRRTSLYGGFINQAAILINYTPAQTIHVIQ